MQHVLITGGTGLIGREVVSRLNKQGHHITVLTRNKSRAARLFKEYDNLSIIDSLESLTSLNSYTTVINLAGEPIADKRWSYTQQSKICDSRWLITEKLVALFRKSKQPPHTFISGSAVGMYGRQDNTPITENFTDYHNEFSHKVCAKWEKIACTVPTDRTRLCILRTGIVLAEEGGALSKMLLPFRMSLGGPIGNGNQYMPWIHLKDMVNGILFLMNSKNATGIYNFTAPNPVSNNEFSQQLADRLLRPIYFRVPKFVIKLMMGESSDLVLYGQNAVPQKLLSEGFEFTYPTIKQALAGLDI